MIANKSLLLLPGDGIGPEVMTQARRVLSWLQTTNRASFEITEDLVGGASVDVHGVPLTDAALERAMAADAVLFGAVGGPQYDKLPFDIRPDGDEARGFEGTLFGRRRAIEPRAACKHAAAKCCLCYRGAF